MKHLFLIACAIAVTVLISGSVMGGDDLPPVAREADQFKGMDNPSKNMMLPSNARMSRSLDVFYKRRAYSGAPPYIPHKITSEMKSDKKYCLSCHAGGGYSEKFSAFSPITPHPDKLMCRQCHVPRNTAKLFKGIQWKTADAPQIKLSALPGGPPIVPHALSMRTDCLACHGGPAAVFEIRTPHPERVYCRQCHVQMHGDK